MKWIGHWQYSYKGEIISLELNLNTNTYSYWLHSAKIKKGGFSNEYAAKNAAKEYLNNCPVS